jgi:hypothetical protein
VNGNALPHYLAASWILLESCATNSMLIDDVLERFAAFTGACWEQEEDVIARRTTSPLEKINVSNEAGVSR